ncbi:MAG TPA: CHC2 zinc finger domain-containing protein [Chloroflexota bacterium]|nr:CHC2 zinc finger domain-containing protein [Chloroflexota bacterium]
MPVVPLATHYQEMLGSGDQAIRDLAREQLRRLSGAIKPEGTPRENNATPDDRLLAAIVAVVGPLAPRSDGRQVGPCPWHGSRTGSCLVVWPAEGRWWCSSCKRGGDLVKWTSLIEGIDYATARRKLRLPRRPAGNTHP